VIFVHIEDTFPPNARGQRRDRRECGRLRHYVNLSDVTHYKIPCSRMVDSRASSFAKKKMVGEYAPVKQKLGGTRRCLDDSEGAAIDTLVSQAQAKFSWCADIVSSLCLSITPSPRTPVP
jgi:hypothetical protein